MRLCIISSKWEPFSKQHYNYRDNTLMSQRKSLPSTLCRNQLHLLKVVMKRTRPRCKWNSKRAYLNMYDSTIRMTVAT